MKVELRIDQAVILCGGLGTRLRPLTNELPKPMVDVNGRPFLHHLLEQLSNQGINRFLLLTGYLNEKISNYFGDGSQYGWVIKYSVGPIDWETGRRVWEACNYIDSNFLLMYSDNYVAFNLPKLMKLHAENAAVISLLLAPKSTGNIKSSEDGIIKAYDNLRVGNGFDYVEVGYMIVNKDRMLKCFSSLSGFPDLSFSKVLEYLAKQQCISGLVVRDPYHSISDPNRLKLTSDFLRPKKIILIDRDGTLNQKAKSGEYITNWNSFAWIPETREAMKILTERGFKFIIITNQAGIARGLIDPIELHKIHHNMIGDLANSGIEVLKVYVCPDHWEDNSFMRKPSPGMFFQAAKDFNLRLDRCLYVGDDERDCIAAVNAGCGMIYLGGEELQSKLVEVPSPFRCSNNLMESLNFIIEAYSN